MAFAAERVAYVEGRVEEHGTMLNGIREAMVHLEQRMDQRFDSMDAKMSRQFTWLIGLYITTLVGVIGALVAAIVAR